MVFTRSQKRKVDEIFGGQEGPEEAPKVQKPDCGISAVFRKRQKTSDDASDKSSSTDDTSNTMSDSHTTSDDTVRTASEYFDESDAGSTTGQPPESESEFQTEPTTVDGDYYDGQSGGDTSNDESTQNEANQGDQALQKILNIKINPSQMQEILKSAVKQLVKKYQADDREFGSDDNGQEENKSPHDTFLDIVDSIYGGEFFERVPIEERAKKFKKSVGPEEVQKMNEQLLEIKNTYKNSAPSIVDILRMDVPMQHKQKLLEKMHSLANSELLTEEYNRCIKYLATNVSNCDPELVALEESIKRKCEGNTGLSYKQKILKSDMPFENKVIAYEKLQIMETYEDSDTSEYAKYKNWMDTLLAVPFGKTLDLPVNAATNASEEVCAFISDVRNTLDEEISFLENPKDQIINLVTQMVRNPASGINAIGLYGPKGVGKTSLIKSISKALGRPYRMISLGGESDSSVLTGHGFTYVGSMPGRIIDILKETQCMNPIILVDELDKISGTQKGKEIVGTLIHMTDYSTNNKYNYDRYFSGMEFDISKAIFIFTYNDPQEVDKILADRLFKIKVDSYTFQQKLDIARKHIIPTVLQQFNLQNSDITFSEDTLKAIVNKSAGEEGMRDVKRNIEIVISRVNTLALTKGNRDKVIHLKYNDLAEEYKELPAKVQPHHVDTLLTQTIFSATSSNRPPDFMYT